MREKRIRINGNLLNRVQIAVEKDLLHASAADAVEYALMQFVRDYEQDKATANDGVLPLATNDDGG